jgi:hypothetical protein
MGLADRDYMKPGSRQSKRRSGRGPRRGNTRLLVVIVTVVVLLGVIMVLGR